MQVSVFLEACMCLGSTVVRRSPKRKVYMYVCAEVGIRLIMESTTGYILSIYNLLLQNVARFYPCSKYIRISLLFKSGMKLC